MTFAASTKSSFRRLTKSAALGLFRSAAFQAAHVAQAFLPVRALLPFRGAGRACCGNEEVPQHAPTLRMLGWRNPQGLFVAPGFSPASWVWPATRPKSRQGRHNLAQGGSPGKRTEKDRSPVAGSPTRASRARVFARKKEVARVGVAAGATHRCSLCLRPLCVNSVVLSVSSNRPEPRSLRLASAVPTIWAKCFALTTQKFNKVADRHSLPRQVGTALVGTALVSVTSSRPRGTAPCRPPRADRPSQLPPRDTFPPWFSLCPAPRNRAPRRDIPGHSASFQLRAGVS